MAWTACALILCAPAPLQELVPLLEGGNLVDAAWAAARPPPPARPLRVHALRWAGEDVPAKLTRMREQVRV